MEQSNYRTPRPLSAHCLHSPSDFSSSSSRHSYAPRRPRTAVTSHYRPFSTLYEEQGIEDPPPSSKSLPSRRRSFIRPVSSSGLQALTAMNLFKDRAKDKPKDMDAPRKNVPEKQPKRPESPHKTGFAPPTAHQRLKKKPSVASLAADEASSSTSSQASATSQSSTITITQRTATRNPVQTSNDDPATRKSQFIQRDNMKLHRYAGEAPYPQAYDPILLENDRYTDILLRRLNSNGSPSFYDYGSTPPNSVLDLGSGPGYWALHAVTTWKNCEVYAFDLVDVRLPEVKLNNNIIFRRGNFVQHKLPFADKSFELVRMANLSLCIPYEKWDFVLAEVQRVLTVGGRLELIDDQIFFPYAPDPVAVEPEVAPSRTSKRISSDSDYEEDLFNDDDSHNSGDTGSILTSDGDTTTSSSCTRQHPHSSDASLKRSSSRNSQPVPPGILRRMHMSPQARLAWWKRQASSSRDLETIFEDMLMKHAHIHTRPNDFILWLLKSKFGVENAKKSESFHISLAPPDVDYDGLHPATSMRPESFEGPIESHYSTNTDTTVSHVATKGTRWGIGWKERKSKDDQGQRDKNKQKLGDGGIVSSTPDKPTSIILPPTNSAKAAGLLGISYSQLATASREESVKKGNEVIDLAKSHALTPPRRLSAKAALRLGVSYSVLAAATAASTRKRQPSPVISSPVQSPGIVVQPSKYIPLSPMELEMHACKYLHTLLGCKPALREWIESFRDENGERLIGDREFGDILWDYECFRRSRFNWPAELLETTADDASSEELWTLLTPHSTTSYTGDGVTPTQAHNDVNDARYDIDSLTRLRSIRVYHATKTDDKSLVNRLFPRLA